MIAPPMTVAPKLTELPFWISVRFTFSVMFSKLWSCSRPAKRQSSPRLMAFQSKACKTA